MSTAPVPPIRSLFRVALIVALASCTREVTSDSVNDPETGAAPAPSPATADPVVTVETIAEHWTGASGLLYTEGDLLVMGANMSPTGRLEDCSWWIDRIPLTGGDGTNLIMSSSPIEVSWSRRARSTSRTRAA